MRSDYHLYCTWYWKLLCFEWSRPFGVSVAVSAEAPAWAAPTDWKEKDFDAEIKKLEADAEQRLDTKITELMGNIEKTGKAN